VESPPNSRYTTYVYTQKSPATKNYMELYRGRSGVAGGAPPNPELHCILLLHNFMVHGTPTRIVICEFRLRLANTAP